MEGLIVEKVDAFWKGVERGMGKRGQITVTFAEKKPKKSWFPVYAGDEEIPWEQWCVLYLPVYRLDTEERTVFY